MRKRTLSSFLLALGLTAGAALPAAAQEGALTLTPISTYTTGVFDEGAAEIVAFDPATQSLFVVNGGDKTIDVLDASDVTALTLKTQLSLADYGDAATSVAVREGVLAVAVAADPHTEPGQVAFFSTEGEPLSAVEVGALPDMLTFSPDGRYVVVANEGEPSDDYTIDPEGSVSIIDVSAGAANVTQENVRTAGFTAFDAAANPDVRVYGPNATLAQDAEPEYIAISPDSATAYATLQEINTIAVIDLETAAVTALLPLGYKDHSLEGNALDASNEDGGIHITNWPVFGMYLPDAIASLEANGALYLLTANEGDTRDYDGYSEETKVGEVTLDPEAFPNAAELQLPENLGNLTITAANGDSDGDGDYDALYLPGARSFSVWSAEGTLVWDSGDQFERITAELYPEHFNSNGDNDSFDGRSDNKGPEPEGIALGTLNDHTYAFIALERIGGVMVYDVTDPTAPVFVTHAQNRDYTGSADAGTAGDIGPEGLIFVPADASPNSAPLLVVANEVSGSTTVYAITIH